MNDADDFGVSDLPPKDFETRPMRSTEGMVMAVAEGGVPRATQELLIDADSRRNGRGLMTLLRCSNYKQSLFFLLKARALPNLSRCLLKPEQ